MRKGCLYNVRQGVWHNIAMSDNAKIAIVQRRDTNLKDVLYRPLTKQQIKKARIEIDRAW